MKRSAKGVGLAIIGGGRVGLFRGEVGPKIDADFVTQSHVELLKRPEVTAAIICTDEHLHVDPIMAAVERGIPMLIEKPLATNLAESERVLQAIKAAKLDAVVGYTQRFRRRWLAAKEKCRTGALGDVTMVTLRAFLRWSFPARTRSTFACGVWKERRRSNVMRVRSTGCWAPPTRVSMARPG